MKFTLLFALYTCHHKASHNKKIICCYVWYVETEVRRWNASSRHINKGSTPWALDQTFLNVYQRCCKISFTVYFTVLHVLQCELSNDQYYILTKIVWPKISAHRLLIWKWLFTHQTCDKLEECVAVTTLYEPVQTLFVHVEWQIFSLYHVSTAIIFTRDFVVRTSLLVDLWT